MDSGSHWDVQLRGCCPVLLPKQTPVSTKPNHDARTVRGSPVAPDFPPRGTPLYPRRPPSAGPGQTSTSESHDYESLASFLSLHLSRPRKMLRASGASTRRTDVLGHTDLRGWGGSGENAPSCGPGYE